MKNLQRPNLPCIFALTNGTPLFRACHFFYIKHHIMADIVYVTKEGLEKMKEELQHLITIERPKASNAIAEAREKGDLSENAEYDAAKEAQGLLELRISKLQDAIGNARILDPSQLDTSKVSVLSKVKVLNIKMKREFIYTLVSENEADLKQMKISVKSPIGSALLGKAVGDKVDVETPGGIIPMEIKEISI
jgi:transcription elongation factor GreA